MLHCDDNDNSNSTNVEMDLSPSSLKVAAQVERVIKVYSMVTLIARAH